MKKHYLHITNWMVRYYSVVHYKLVLLLLLGAGITKSQYYRILDIGWLAWYCFSLIYIR